jgi:hypothetical protein
MKLNLRDVKSVAKIAVLVFFAIAVIANAPFLYQQGKELGAEIYKLTQGDKAK